MHHRSAKKTLGVPSIVLVGNPNVGKSVVFSYLTGRYAVVSNYPGTTVEVSTGENRFLSDSVVIDTPGANSLHPQSVDERVTRDILVSSDVRLVLQVADAKNLRRGLTISTQLAEMDMPVVLVLNMMDEASRRGIKISSEALAEKLGIPVVETIAIEKKGFKKLAQSLSLQPAIPDIRVDYPAEIEKGIERISSIVPESRAGKRGIALMFLSNPDEAAESMAPFIGRETALAAKAVALEVQERFSNPLNYIIGVSRSKTVDALLDTVFLRDVRRLGKEARGRMKRKYIYGWLAFASLSLAAYSLFGFRQMGQWGLHPTLLHLMALFLIFTVIPYRALERLTTHYILGVFFLFEVLYLMYKFVGVFGAGTLVDLIENGLFNKALLPVITPFFNRILPVDFLSDLLVGKYGLISMGLTYAIAIVMPIVAAFFFAFSILEDSGYLPRLSVIADRAMRKVGLNGKAVLPMVLGLGCATMATLTTRILDTKKERVIATLLLAMGIPCSAQLGVVMAIVSQTSLAVVLTVAGVIVLQLVLVGTLSNLLIKGKNADFIVELPPLRPPQFLNIAVKTLHRLKWFLFEAVPLFLAGTLVLFIVDKAGGIGLIERMGKPVISGLLGLPEQSTLAFIMGFFRRDYGAAGLFDLFSNGLLSHNQVAVSMVVITLFVPCMANFLVMIKERGAKVALAMVAFILPYAILVGSILNFVLSSLDIRL